ncbi:unnamed protein product, partial [Onchocerca flexuosa]|uniref:Lipoprotein n=1 Tax=Onchocerca flexuosa TaxID=387005 RepID=A0A183I7Z8_9BILA
MISGREVGATIYLVSYIDWYYIPLDIAVRSVISDIQYFVRDQPIHTSFGTTS